MADIYSREQGRRLFGVIAAGWQHRRPDFLRRQQHPRAGNWLREPVSDFRSTAQRCGPCASASCGTGFPGSENDTRCPGKGEGRPLGGSPFAGVTHALSSMYFGGIAVSSVIASLLGTFLYMFTAQLVEQSIPDPDRQTQFFSIVNAATLAVSLLGQMFLRPSRGRSLWNWRFAGTDADRVGRRIRDTRH